MIYRDAKFKNVGSLELQGFEATLKSGDESFHIVTFMELNDKDPEKYADWFKTTNVTECIDAYKYSSIILTDRFSSTSKKYTRITSIVYEDLADEEVIEYTHENGHSFLRLVIKDWDTHVITSYGVTKYVLLNPTDYNDHGSLEEDIHNSEGIVLDINWDDKIVEGTLE